MANRKLQTEIEKVLKKVDDGVLVFEQIWDKVYSAMTPSQKEKYEGDLKKEIKKLQRLRDSIKTWQGDPSIKDKTKLDAARKLIEEKMEKFKICEKETKTKAFSKEGLALDRTDPRERAKREVGDWITDAITRLRDQCDEFEAEIESLSGTGKKGKKGSQSSARVSDLRDHTERHNHHISMLERILRAVDNETVSCEEANDLKESIDYYIDANQEPDFYEDEGMYDALDLEAVTPGAQALNNGSVQSLEKKTSLKNSNSPPESSPPKQNRILTTARTVPANESLTKAPSQGKSPPKSAKTSPGVQTLRSDAEMPLTLPKVLPSTQPPPITPNTSGRQPLLSSIVKGEISGQTGSAMGGATSVASPTSRNLQTNSSIQQIPPASPPTLDGDKDSILPRMGELTLTSSSPDPMQMASGRNQGVAAQQQAEIGIDTDASSGIGKHPFMLGMSGISNLGQPGAPAMGPSREASSNPGEELPAEGSSGVFAGGIGNNGGGSIVGRTQTPMGLSSQELSKQLNILESTMQFMPESAENEANMAASRPYQPRNLAQVPSSFPTVPAPIFDNPAIFQQFDVDTLFFIFYYQQGTYQQYLAARELKDQSWRFHKQYLTWFKRHEEPKITTDEYEQGSYFFFDYFPKENYETGWCSRIKTDFTFEYRYLEDELQ